MRIAGVLLIIVAAVVVIFASGACIANGLSLGKDIGAPLNRAQVAASAEDMDKYMAQVQDGMERNGLTSGHWGFTQMFGVNQNVDNDFGVAYEAVKNIRTRLASIKTFDRNSTQYQVGLDDIRGTIRELDIGQQEWNAWQHHWWVALVWFVGILLAIIGAAAATET